MPLEGRTKIRMVGIDISQTAVETAQAISNWIGGAPAKFYAENLTFPVETPIDCEGRDVVFFSISALNKIKTLDSNVFKILVSRVKNYGRIRFVLIESFGWQIYRDKALNRFFLEMDTTINDLGETNRPILRRQIQLNESPENTNNLNLAQVIQQNVETGYVDLSFFQAHAVGLHLGKTYSVATLTLA